MRLPLHGQYERNSCADQGTLFIASLVPHRFFFEYSEESVITTSYVVRAREVAIYTIAPVQQSSSVASFPIAGASYFYMCVWLCV